MTNSSSSRNLTHEFTPQQPCLECKASDQRRAACEHVAATRQVQLHNGGQGRLLIHGANRNRKRSRHPPTEAIIGAVRSSR